MGRVGSERGERSRLFADAARTNHRCVKARLSSGLPSRCSLVWGMRSLLLRFGLAGVLLVTSQPGCDRPLGGSAQKPTPPPTAVRSTAETPPASGPAGRHPNPLAAIQRCREAMTQVAAAPPQAVAALVSEGCSDLFVEPACREAVRRFESVDPAARAGTLARSCRDAYCPKLKEPRPTLCAADLTRIAPTELAQQWPTFAGAALAFDLGAEVGTVGALMAQALGQVTVVQVDTRAPAIAKPAPELQLRAKGEGKWLQVQMVLPGGSVRTWRLPLPPSPEDLKPLGTVANEQPADTHAVLQLDRELSYGTAVALMDILRAAGIQRLSLAIAP